MKVLLAFLAAAAGLLQGVEAQTNSFNCSGVLNPQAGDLSGGVNETGIECVNNTAGNIECTYHCANSSAGSYVITCKTVSAITGWYKPGGSECGPLHCVLGIISQCGTVSQTTAAATTGGGASTTVAPNPAPPPGPATTTAAPTKTTTTPGSKKKKKNKNWWVKNKHWALYTIIAVPLVLLLVYLNIIKTSKEGKPKQGGSTQGDAGSSMDQRRQLLAMTSW